MAVAKLALIGKSGAGKDAVGLVLQTDYAFKRYAIADELRYWLSDLTGVDLFNLPKDQNIRSALQNVGEAARSINPDVWLLKMLKRIDTQITAPLFSTPVVVTDCRYLNEAALFKRLGFYLIRVVRPTDTQVGFTPAQKNHPSELEQEKIQADYSISNDGTLADLSKHVAQLLEVLHANRLV